MSASLVRWEPKPHTQQSLKTLEKAFSQTHPLGIPLPGHRLSRLKQKENPNDYSMQLWVKFAPHLLTCTKAQIAALL